MLKKIIIICDENDDINSFNNIFCFLLQLEMENDDVIEVYQEQTGGLICYCWTSQFHVYHHLHPKPSITTSRESEEN